MVIKKTLNKHHKINDVRILKENKKSMSRIIFKENQKNNGTKNLSNKKNKIKINSATKETSWMNK